MSFWTLSAVCLLVLLVQAFVIQIAALSALQLALRLRWKALVQLGSLFVEASAGRGSDLPPAAERLLEELRQFLGGGPSWQNAAEVARLHSLLQSCFKLPEFCGDARGELRTGWDAARFTAVLALRVENACAAYDASVAAYEARRRVPWVGAVAGRMGYDVVEGLEWRSGTAESNIGSERLSG
jgi:hypothetical protein